MKFTAILSSLVLVVIMLFSAITGFTRPESFAKYRHDISTAVSNFSLSDLRNAFSDYDGGFDLFGIKQLVAQTEAFLARQQALASTAQQH